MALAQYAGIDVIYGRLHMPLRGVWWSEWKLDTANPPSGQSTLACANGISLVGTVMKAGTFLSYSLIRVVGGAGGLATMLAPSAYRNALSRDPLNAILGACGETLSSTVLPQLLSLPLSYWTINAETGARALDCLVGMMGRVSGQMLNWRIMTDGTVWIGAETWPSVSLPPGTDVIFSHPMAPRFDIGTASPVAGLVPGVTLADVNARCQGVSTWISPDHVRQWVMT